MLRVQANLLTQWYSTSFCLHHEEEHTAVVAVAVAGRIQEC